MIRKVILLTLAFAAFAASIGPAVAGAQLLTDGAILLLGTKATATSTNLKTRTATGILECGKVTMHTEVTINEETKSALNSLSITAEENCTLNQTELGKGHIPMTIEKATAAIGFGEGGVGSSAITFVANIGPGVLKCHFVGLPGVTYVEKTDVFHVEGEMTGGAAPCPPVGFIEGDFTLERSNKVPIMID